MKVRRLLSISFLFIIIDQVIKFIVIDKMKFNSSIEIINDFFKITLVKNQGVAFGFFQKDIYIIVIISIIMLYFFIKFAIESNILSKIYMSMIVSGAIGNLIDRIFRGYVVDYIDFRLFKYDFPVFNLADILIVVGIILFSIDLFRSDEFWKKK